MSMEHNPNNKECGSSNHTCYVKDTSIECGIPCTFPTNQETPESTQEKCSVLHGDCLEVMKTLDSGSIDLTVTSPPYDNLRTYNGYSFDFEGIAKELYRVTKDGGVVVWVVGDATIKGSETGTSFKQALYFKEIGFNLHDTMIWNKTNPPPQTKEGKRYTLAHEYMFILTKGKIKTFNSLQEPCLHSGKSTNNRTQRSQNGTIRKDRTIARIVSKTKPRQSIWYYANSGSEQHPAVFPEQLAEDHILSWSNEGDTVLDPFAGSGTTLKMAKLNNRNYIGIEISQEYIDIIHKRLNI